MVQQVLVVGAGIGGVATALACARSGAQVQLFEQAEKFSEIGAGIQLGPNVVRLLECWGLAQALGAVAAFPQRLEVCDAETGRSLGQLRLGQTMVQSYGAVYATVRRSDLHDLLLSAMLASGSVDLKLGSQIAQVQQHEQGVLLQTRDGQQARGDWLMGADGVRSRVRELMLNDGECRASGHLAYRALVQQSSLPATMRSQQVTLWLGTRLHWVQYPVRGGDWLNLALLVEGQTDPGSELWDHSASADELRGVLDLCCSPLQDLAQAVPHWARWSLLDRSPLSGPHEMAQGRLALLGDAAHPMLPYLAQGAGMALEDADALGQLMREPAVRGPELLQRYAQQRWQRNAKVQHRAIRNAGVFHADGVLRWGRNMAMRLLGERLLDQPWLYRT